MQDLLSSITVLLRPPLLVKAACLGVAYDRTAALPRLIGAAARGTAQAFVALIERKADLEARRRAGTGNYCPTRHIELIVAMMGKARLLRESAFS